MNSSTLKRLQVVLNYIDKDEVSYLEIENLMPDFIKKAILDGKEFRMTYNQDFGYLISFESRDTEKVDEKDLKTSKNNIFAEMEHYSNKNGELCTSIEFKIDDKKWRVIFDFIDEECDNRLYPLYIAYEDSNNKVLRTCYFDGEKSLVIKKLMRKTVIV